MHIAWGAGRLDQHINLHDCHEMPPVIASSAAAGMWRHSDG